MTTGEPQRREMESVTLKNKLIYNKRIKGFSKLKFINVLILIVEILRFENFDLQTINTPINIERYQTYLEQSHYCKFKTKFLIQGFKNGFDFMYRGPQKRRELSKNIPLTVGNKVILWNKVMKEVEQKRYAGPFSQPPFQNFIQSPVGLVPKSNGDLRLIFHLSFNFGHEEERKSFNYHMPQEACTVKYNDLDYAMKLCVRLLKINGMDTRLYFGKTDLKSAFRLVPGRPNQYCWLLMRVEDPSDGKLYFFVDKNLPFGASISCSLFTQFSDSLRHLVEHRLGFNLQICNYLDDFIFISLDEGECNLMVRSFLLLSKQINCPVALDKTEYATTKMIFLGVLLNGDKHILAIPEDKKIKALNLLSFMSERNKATIKEIQCLTGTLNFLSRAIIPGRAYTRLMYTKLKTMGSDGRQLKQYHHVQLNQDFRRDCGMWKFFLNNSLPSLLCRPFMDIDTESTKLDLYSDASRATNLGFTAVYGDEYVCGQWEPGYIEKYNPSIAYLELYALCVGTIG